MPSGHVSPEDTLTALAGSCTAAAGRARAASASTSACSPTCCSGCALPSRSEARTAPGLAGGIPEIREASAQCVLGGGGRCVSSPPRSLGARPKDRRRFLRVVKRGVPRRCVDFAGKGSPMALRFFPIGRRFSSRIRPLSVPFHYPTHTQRKSGESWGCSYGCGCESHLCPSWASEDFLPAGRSAASLQTETRSCPHTRNSTPSSGGRRGP